jgi:ubiquinone/menaquinone biosynthesis C-methylase UbiE
MKLIRTYGKSQIHDEWISVYRSDHAQSKFNDKLMRRWLEIVRAGPGSLFLDAGCGTGNHTKRIAAGPYCCIATDISLEALVKARAAVLQVGRDDRVHFTCQALEEIGICDGTVDVIHCRGVLTHIPDWKSALKEMARVLKPDGWLILLETNVHSLEMGIVKLVRRLSLRESKESTSAEGTEFWTEINGSPFLYRYFNLKMLEHEMLRVGVTIHQKVCAEMWDVNRFPGGMLRRAATAINQLAFDIRCPAQISSTVALMCRKQQAVSTRKISSP